MGATLEVDAWCWELCRVSPPNVGCRLVRLSDMVRARMPFGLPEVFRPGLCFT